MASSSTIRLFPLWTTVRSTRLRCTYRLPKLTEINGLRHNQKALCSGLEYLFE